MKRLVERIGDDLTELSAAGATLKFTQRVSRLEEVAAGLEQPPSNQRDDTKGNTSAADGPSHESDQSSRETDQAKATAGDPEGAIALEYKENVLPREPLSLVLASYEQVTRAALNALERRGIRSPRGMSLAKATNLLHRDGQIDERLRAVIDELRVTRNNAVHLPEESFVTPESAAQYAAVADRVIHYFNNM
ncbi:hypothetical protein GCM10009624_28760 [Gordonia sinesedis]